MKHQPPKTFGLEYQELIDLATACGLIYLTEENPKTHPAHQRLLSKLEKFADEYYKRGVSNGVLEEINKWREDD